MMRPLVKLTSSRICDISSHPAARNAGVMNFVQMSRSERAFLSIWMAPESKAVHYRASLGGTCVAAASCSTLAVGLSGAVAFLLL